MVAISGEEDAGSHAGGGNIVAGEEEGVAQRGKTFKYEKNL
jgi:hypothetical protein